jgi:hypothetical protein
LLNYLTDLERYEPVIVAWALNGGLAVLLGNLVHISSTQEAAVTTIFTAAVAIYSAIRTRPFEVSLFTGAVTTIGVAAAAFGLHLPAHDVGIGAAVLSALVALLLRTNVTPAASVNS